MLYRQVYQVFYIVDFGIRSRPEGMGWAVKFKNGCSEKQTSLGATKNLHLFL
jgi:hypothetical protein